VGYYGHVGGWGHRPHHYRHHYKHHGHGHHGHGRGYYR